MTVATVDTSPAAPAGTDLNLWATEARQVHQIAVSLANTSFVPTAMRNRPDEVTGCILAGRELGFPPMVALRTIDIIDGTPAIRAHGLRGIVQSHGHTVWVEESTETRAIVCGHRAGEAHKVQRSVWTTDRAKKANLTNKKNWANHPQAMLVARATAELCRLIAADAIIGMPYSSEEITDGVTAEVSAPAMSVPAAEPKRTIRRQTKIEPPAQTPGEIVQAESPVTAEDISPLPEVPADEVAREDVTHADTLRMLFAAMRDDDRFKDRNERLVYISNVVGRNIDSATQLSTHEMRMVMTDMHATDADPGQAP